MRLNVAGRGEDDCVQLAAPRGLTADCHSTTRSCVIEHLRALSESLKLLTFVVAQLVIFSECTPFESHETGSRVLAAAQPLQHEAVAILGSHAMRLSLAQIRQASCLAHQRPRLFCARSSASPLSSLSSAATAGSAHHHDLPSFLAYASRVNLSPTSTIYVGTHYEYTVMESLSRLGFQLSRTGGRLDGGIDLLGTWSVPTLPATAPLHMLLQCKALNRKPGPNLIRELEGSFVGAPAAWKKAAAASTASLEGTHGESNGMYETARDQNNELDTASAIHGSSGIMALLVASKEATKGVRDTMGRSRWPMGYAKVTLNGNVEQLLWNKSAADRGLQGLGITTRFKPNSSLQDIGDGHDIPEAEGAPLKQEIVLTWNGQIWETVLS